MYLVVGALHTSMLGDACNRIVEETIATNLAFGCTLHFVVPLYVQNTALPAPALQEKQ